MRRAQLPDRSLVVGAYVKGLEFLLWAFGDGGKKAAVKNIKIISFLFYASNDKERCFLPSKVLFQLSIVVAMVM